MSSKNTRYSEEKLLELMSFYMENGEEETLKAFGITSETLNRTKRQFKAENMDGKLSLPSVMQKIRENFSDKELAILAQGKNFVPNQKRIPQIDFSGDKFKFCAFSDTHIGSIYFHPEMFYSMLEECKKQGVEAYFHAGDVVEGMSGRPGHIYELTHLGLDNQRDYAVELLSNIKEPLYMISGNHDRWFIKSAGANVVGDIADRLENAQFLGHDVGEVKIKKSTIQLWHGEDGSSYSVSYRVQKIIEAMTGGTKPNVLLLGHVHKMCYIFERHIHAFSTGCIETQSAWMRGKRLAAHTGFWIVELSINKKGQVSACKSEWFPFYL